jgi:hypothetical protein
MSGGVSDLFDALDSEFDWLALAAGDTAIYYNNRALAYLRMEKYEASFSDFDQVPL